MKNEAKISREVKKGNADDQYNILYAVIDYIAGLEQERTSCILEETEKIEKQTLHNANKSTIWPIETTNCSQYW